MTTAVAIIHLYAPPIGVDRVAELLANLPRCDPVDAMHCHQTVL